jgi:REP element-mobilizing transposase RayT
MKPLDYRLVYHRKLPHFQPKGATFFVTFRLAGSLPRYIIEKLFQKSREAEKRLQEITDPQERDRELYLEERRQFGRWDTALAQNKSGPFWLRQPEIAQIVANSLHYLGQRVYDLDTYCIMPNHVHAVFTPLQKDDGSYHALPAIMHSLKRHTAKEANKVLKRSGQFWEHENYDHAVRDDSELRRIVEYIIYNPVKAGLVGTWDAWPWTYCKKLL